MLAGHAGFPTLARVHALWSVAALRRRTLPIQALILLGTIGCSAPPIVSVDAGRPVDLGGNEALLIVQIDTEFALKRLLLNNRPIAQSLGKGRHLWMIRLPSGSYRWTSVEIGNQPRSRSEFRLDPDEELRFEVQAGKINYPGELIIRSDSLSRWGSGNLTVRNRNHSAMAIRELKSRYDAVLRSLPLHYAGLSGDRFLDYYTQQRDHFDVDSSGAVNPQGRLNTQSATP